MGGRDIADLSLNSIFNIEKLILNSWY